MRIYKANDIVETRESLEELNVSGVNKNYEYILVKSFKDQVRRILPELNKEHGIGLIGVFGNATSELSHSYLIYVLLNPKSFSDSEYIGSSFLNLISDKCGIEKLKQDHILSIEREKVTNTGRRIDIYVTTENYNIIVENKIFAEDQESQLQDYVDYIEQYFPDKTTIVLYLTPFGQEPSSWSIPKSNINKLKNQNRFAAISYERDIYGWLDSLALGGILKYEIEVYKKTIKEDVCHMNNTSERFFKKYYLDMKSLIIENPNDVQECIHSLNYIATTVKNLNMIQYLFKLLEEKKFDVKFVCEQSFLYSCFSEYEQKVLDNYFKPYGICVNVSDNLRIGLEYNPRNECDGVWYFGFMKGIDGTPAEIKNKDGIEEEKLTPDWEKEKYKIYEPSDWWGECVLADHPTKEYIYNNPQNAANIILEWFENQIKFTNNT